MDLTSILATVKWDQRLDCTLVNGGLTRVQIEF